MRGSILDVYSFSCELPYRIDFFGDDIDTIRSFEVESQLSHDKLQQVEVVPELATLTEEKVPFLQFLPDDTLLVAKNFLYIHDTVQRVYDEGFSSQALTEQLEGKTEMEQEEIKKELKRETQLITGSQFIEDAGRYVHIEFGNEPTGVPQARIEFNIVPQPLFHKNFELLERSLEDYLLQQYKIYILADSEKQTRRLADIFSDQGKDITFVAVGRTLHEGFADNDLHVCCFTDHQIFDRYHKYNLRSDAARNGKMALTMKELQEMEPGDYIVHVDLGIGRFAGLVRAPIASTNTQPHHPTPSNTKRSSASSMPITTRWM